MPKKSQMIHARIDPRLKKTTETIFANVGLSTAEAIRLFLKQVELHEGLPFAVVTPNKKTVAAMRAANAGKGLKHYRSFRELRDS